MKAQTCFALVDCNNFYVSCERVFRPDLQDKPVGVLSNNDGFFFDATRLIFRAFNIISFWFKMNITLNFKILLFFKL